MDNGDFPLRNAACDVSFLIIFTFFFFFYMHFINTT